MNYHVLQITKSASLLTNANHKLDDFNVFDFNEKYASNFLSSPIFFCVSHSMNNNQQQL